MNILILSPFSPYPFNQGGKIRIFNMIKNLSRSNSVTLAAIVEDKTRSEPGPLKELCDDIIFVERPPKLWGDRFRFIFGRTPYNIIRYHSIDMKEELDRLLRQKSFDIVQIEFPMMWQYADIFNAIPIVLDAMNIESEIVRQLKDMCREPVRRLLYAIEERRFRKKERQVWRECSFCFAVSEKERNVITSYLGNSDKVFTITNGVDIERFEFQQKDYIGNQLLFLGGMDYIPNRDSAMYFLNRIFPLTKSKICDVKLDIVGRELWWLQDHISMRGIELHENVPEILPYFRNADVLVVPLRCGAGTRIKILEAMAAGLPVVTTSKGCEGTKVTNGEHLLIADSPEDFADAVQRILEDSDLRNFLTRNARDLVEKKYSWEMIAREMEGLYNKI